MRITRIKEIEMDKTRRNQTVECFQRRDLPNQVCYAELLSPDVVETELRRHSEYDNDLLNGSWLLNGVVSESFFCLLEKTNPSNIKGEFGYLKTNIGADYGMIVSQIGCAQHRFLLPLYSELVRELFETPSIEAINIFYENAAHEGVGLNYECAISNDDALAVRSRMQSIDLERTDEYISELSDVIAWVGRPSYGRSLVKHMAVLSVDMSVLVPFSEISTELGLTV